MRDPTRAYSYTPLRPLGRAVMLLLALGVVATVVDLAHDIRLLSLLGAVIDQRSRAAVLEMAAAFEFGDRILFPTLGILAVTAVVFLVWVYRASANAHALGFGDLKFRPGWAVGWWFVPIANLIQAPRTMLELYRVALAGGPAGLARPHRQRPGPRVVAADSVRERRRPLYGTGRIGSGEGFEPFRQALIAWIAGMSCICPPASSRSGSCAGSPPASKARRWRRIGRIGAGLSEILDFFARERRPRLQIPGRP